MSRAVNDMKFICRTCGGECALVREDAAVSEYKCTCCDNTYVVRKGEELSYRARPDSRPARREAPPRTGVARPVAQPAPTAGRAAEDGKLSGEQIYVRCIDSVIEVRAISGKTMLSGSAYAVGGGYAVTNAHVVASGGRAAERIEAYVCGKTCRAEIVALGTGGADGDDLALLRLQGAPAEVKSVKFADFSEVKNGQTLFVIGNSLGGGTCITSGIVSDRLRTVEGKPRLMTDCAVNRGNSGGPVFNAAGEVVGTIVAVTATAEGMNYAIPADAVKRFLSRCKIKI